MARQHQIEPGQWIDLDSIARLWIVDFDPAHEEKLYAGLPGRPAKAKAVPLQFIAWVGMKDHSMIELGRYGDRKDAVDRIEALAKLWVGGDHG